MSDKIARNIAITAVAVFLIVMAVLLTNTWGAAKPVHAQYGYALDSLCWYLYTDSVKTDSSGKLYDVTGWPDTSFDMGYGHYHQVRFYAWVYGYDSSCWTWDWDMYDYNNANCVGGGAYVAAFVVYDTVNDEPVYRAKVTIKQDSSLGSTEYWDWTGTNGYVEFGLDNGDWSAVTSKPRFISSPLDFTIASDNYSDTIFGYQLATPSAPTLDYAIVEGYVYSPSGERFFGATVTARRVEGDFASDTTTTPVIIGKKPTTVPIDTAGYFSMTLMRTTSYDDTTTGFYNIVGMMSTGPEIFTVTSLYIPATGDVDLGLIVGRR